jgi:tetratricopeptide (TPR) repeat protein
MITPQKILSNIAEIQAQKGDFDEAINTANLIEWDILRCKALHIIGKSSLSSGKNGLSEQLYSIATRIAVESKHLDIEPLLKEIIVQQAELGDFESAHKNSMHIKAAYDRAETLARIGASRAKIKGYADAQESFEEAIRVANEIYDVGNRIGTMIKIALMEAEAGGIQVARKTILKAKDLTGTLNEWYPKFDSMLKIAFAEAKTGQTEKSRQTFRDVEKIVEDDERIHLVGAIAVKQAEAGFVRDALQSSKKLIKKPFELISVAAAFLERGEIGYFLSTVFLFPYHNGVAKRMCVLLSQAFPEKASEIADSVNKYVEDEDIGMIVEWIGLDQLPDFPKPASAK